MLGYWILTRLSREPNSADYQQSGVDWKPGKSLSLLESEIPRFRELVAGRRVVDFGSGRGYQCIDLASKYGCDVLGIENNPRTLADARLLAHEHGAAVTYAESCPRDQVGTYDAVISQNAFEHFDDPAQALIDMAHMIHANGKILITFGPPWYSPYGSHMHFFCKVPWLNLLFPEKTVMAVRSLFRDDGAKRYEEVESGLNKMSLAKLERLVRESELRVAFKSYRVIKGIKPLATIPLIRELFVNHATVILEKA